MDRQSDHRREEAMDIQSDHRREEAKDIQSDHMVCAPIYTPMNETFVHQHGPTNMVTFSANLILAVNNSWAFN